MICAHKKVYKRKFHSFLRSNPHFIFLLLIGVIAVFAFTFDSKVYSKLENQEFNEHFDKVKSPSVLDEKNDDFLKHYEEEEEPELFVSTAVEEENIGFVKKKRKPLSSYDSEEPTALGQELLGVTTAEQLYNEVKVFCWVNTWPKNHKTKAKAVKETWGRRCNKLVFISTEHDEYLNSVALPLKDGRQYLWSKIRGAFKYIYENYYNDYDWFVRADDDTYMIVENLRYMLYQHTPRDPIHLGAKFKTFVKQGYMSGGAGYVLSKEAVRRFVVEGIPNEKYCLQGESEMDDVEIGRCLERLNVTAGDTRDSNGRGRMFPLSPTEHFVTVLPPTSSYWYWKYMFYPATDGRNCCSDRAISFHYVSHQMMYVMDYLIYDLNPFGLNRKPDVLP